MKLIIYVTITELYMIRDMEGVTGRLSGGLLVEKQPPPRNQIKPLSRI